MILSGRMQRLAVVPKYPLHSSLRVLDNFVGPYCSFCSVSATGRLPVGHPQEAGFSANPAPFGCTGTGHYNPLHDPARKPVIRQSEPFGEFCVVLTYRVD